VAFTVTPANTLVSGETMPAGDSLTSADGHFQLTMQSDGNLVEYVAGTGHVVWDTGTAGHAGAFVIMQSDGNLVVYQGSTPLWFTGTTGHPGAYLVDQQDSNQVVYSGSTALWSSNGSSPHLTLGSWPGTAGPGAAAQYYGYPYPDPPACTDGGSCIADQWGFYEGQCTSWVAYRLNQLNGIAFSNSFGGGGRWGNASNWGPMPRHSASRSTALPQWGAWPGTPVPHRAPSATSPTSNRSTRRPRSSSPI
jgi:hypothetical protein